MSRRIGLRCVFTRQLGGTSSRTGLAAVFGWIIMAPKMAKTTKAPQVSRGKTDMVIGAELRDRKQPFSQMTQISKHRMKGQRGLLVEKEPLQTRGSLKDVSSKDEAVEGVGRQIP
ncbi:hypothetical protein NDU88_001277 [Pleurodeles waltl]|uniref:Uncharacterized protein n=1 Tax=Pleurodeles waltl TaxID=8319 RepID=A0AAV7VWF6_PLEWA|nr:hypothetical protein NDU88_001277 [Pleurodeles waltl]